MSETEKCENCKYYDAVHNCNKAQKEGESCIKNNYSEFKIVTSTDFLIDVVNKLEVDLEMLKKEVDELKNHKCKCNHSN